MTVFTIYYRPNQPMDGLTNIESYVQSGQLPPESETPPGCARVCFDQVVRLCEPPSWSINVRVDHETKHLIPIVPPKLVTPEMQNALEQANQPEVAVDPNREIRSAPRS